MGSEEFILFSLGKFKGTLGECSKYLLICSGLNGVEYLLIVKKLQESYLSRLLFCLKVSFLGTGRLLPFSYLWLLSSQTDCFSGYGLLNTRCIWFMGACI